MMTEPRNWNTFKRSLAEHRRNWHTQLQIGTSAAECVCKYSTDDGIMSLRTTAPTNSIGEPERSWISRDYAADGWQRERGKTPLRWRLIQIGRSREKSSFPAAIHCAAVVDFLSEAVAAAVPRTAINYCVPMIVTELQMKPCPHSSSK